MLATERTTVTEINQLARARLIARGDVSRRTRTYRAPDDRRAIPLSVGDQVILRRNQRLTQPDGTDVAVRNGMTRRVVATRRRSVTVELDTQHRTPGGPSTITLPAGYVGEHVEYGYARTVDTAQGATVDHSLFAPSTGSSAERAYVALSRGRLTNRIYATHDRAWIDAIGRGRSHALAVDQTPQPGHTPTGPWDAETSHTAANSTPRSNSRCRRRATPPPEPDVSGGTGPDVASLASDGSGVA
jgi:ATP-dependent exoDNAse (exonuclease V) alpha subunit